LALLLLEVEVVDEHVDGAVKEAAPTVATGVVGVLGVHQATDESDVQVEVLRCGDAVVREELPTWAMAAFETARHSVQACPNIAS